MEFTGDIYYDYESIDVWRLYSTLLRASAQDRVEVNVSWKELPGPIAVTADDELVGASRLLAACAVVAKTDPDKHQRLVQALLTLVFEHKDDPTKDTTLMVAAKVAGLDGSALLEVTGRTGSVRLAESRSVAEEQAISAAPTIVRHGPPLHIRTTPALNRSDSVATIELINRMFDHDGIWALSKP